MAEPIAIELEHKAAIVGPDDHLVILLSGDVPPNQLKELRAQVAAQWPALSGRILLISRADIAPAAQPGEYEMWRDAMRLAVAEGADEDDIKVLKRAQWFLLQLRQGPWKPGTAS